MKPYAIVPMPRATDVGAALTGASPPLVRTVRALLGPGRLPEANVVIVAAVSHVPAVRAHLVDDGLSGIAVVGDAGGTRRSCVSSGLEHLARETVSPSHVLVHDPRHPLVPAAVTDRVLAALRDGSDMVVPVLAMTDSVKSVDAGGSVIGTVDRSALKSIQYPRGFTGSVLSELLALSIDDVDELFAILRVGVPITTVDGDGDGFRVELPADMTLLNAIIASR